MAQLDFKGWLTAGVLGGALWGFVAFAVNSVTGVFAFEGTVAGNILAFVVAGFVVGGVTGGLLVVSEGLLPGVPLMTSDVAKAVFVATSLRASLCGCRLVWSIFC